MANPLTGQFDAALQISVQRINGLLATMHQNRWEREQNPNSKLATFPHTDRLRLGPEPFHLDPALLHIAAWMQRRQDGEPENTHPDPSGISSFLSSLPPDTAAALMEHFVNWQSTASTASEATGSMARGLAEMQISAPYITLANGDMNEVTVHVSVRARYLADTPSHLLPEYIHGEVRIGYEMKREGNSLKVVPSEDDSKISFISNTTIAHVVTAAITKEVTLLVRERFRPNFVDVTSDFGFSGAFRALGSGSNQVLAMPVSLTGGVPTGGAGSLTSAWLGNQDFALAVSKEFVGEKFEPALAPLRGFSVRFTVNVDVLIFDLDVAEFTLRILDARLEWSAGLVTLRIDAKLLASVVFGAIRDSYDIVVTQKMRFELAAGLVTLTAVDGDLEVTGAPTEFGIHGEAWKAARDARNRALPAVQQMIPRMFQDGESPDVGKGALRRIRVALRRFDPELEVAYKNLEVNASGLIARGSISGGKRMAPIAHIGSADGGDSYTALHSWIPGGRIEKLHWGMWEKVPFQKALATSGLLWTLPWEGLPRFSGEETEHFMFPNAWTLPRSTAVCLTIHGSRRNLKGVLEEEDIWGFDYVRNRCAPVELPPLFIDVNWKEFKIPNIWPDLTGEAILEDLVFAHIDAAVPDWPGSELTTNHLVHFMDWSAEQPMQVIEEALSMMKKKQFSLSLMVVVPQGRLKVSRHKMEEKLGLAGPHEKIGQKKGQSPVHIQVVEDLNRGWSEVFHASGAPATYFVNAHRQRVWDMDGPVEPGELAAVLDKQMVPAPAARNRLPALAIRPGNRLPPISFVDDQGNAVRLRDFSKKELKLCFWSSTSRPCIRELQRLEEMQKADGDLVVVGLCGDEDAKVIPRIREKYQLSMILAQDPDRNNARTLKVRCWPTTLSVTRENILHSVQFGYPMKEGLGQK